MATCIHSLAVSGSRLPDGSVNAGGRVFLTRPGTANQRVLGYEDEDKQATIPLSSGGYLLGQDGKLAIFVDEPCIVRIEDQYGASVDSFSVQSTTSANLIEVISSGFTGINSDTGQYEAGRRTYLGTALGSIAASCGGLDGNFRGVYGSVDVPLRTELEQVHLTPYRFGGVGNGSHDDTAAFIAMFAAQSASSIPIYIPKGTWIVASTITTACVGAVVNGAGISVTVILGNNGSQGMFVFSSGFCRLSNMSISHATTSSGTAVTMAASCILDAVSIQRYDSALNASAGHVDAYSCILNGTTNATVGTCKIISGTITGATSGGTTSAQFA